MATRSKFDGFLAELADRALAKLRDTDFSDRASGGPNAQLVEEAVRPYLGEQELAVPKALQSIINAAPGAGTAAEYMGKPSLSLAWYSVGQYAWRGQAQFRRVLGTTPDVGVREAAGSQQLRAAICADRAGNKARAAQLYEWAAANYILTTDELGFFRDTKQLQVIWERLPYRAYALGCLDRRDEALSVAEECQRWVENDHRAQTTESYQAPLKILSVVLALARYRAHPTEEDQRKAVEMLNPQSVASRSHGDHLHSLFHLFNLRARYPELANPASEHLPFVGRAKQGEEACRRLMPALAQISLDASIESLMHLDQRAKQLRRVYKAAPEAEEVEGPAALVSKKGLIFMLGSYFGEVVRKELAGGQWKADDRNLLASTLDWEMGEIELHLWPFNHAFEYLTGKTKKTFHQLWQETEQSYLHLGLAAKHAE